jgi:hypothetical protein
VGSNDTGRLEDFLKVRGPSPRYDRDSPAEERRSEQDALRHRSQKALVGEALAVAAEKLAEHESGNRRFLRRQVRKAGSSDNYGLSHMAKALKGHYRSGALRRQMQRRIVRAWSRNLRKAGSSGKNQRATARRFRRQF